MAFKGCRLRSCSRARGHAVGEGGGLIRQERERVRKQERMWVQSTSGGAAGRKEQGHPYLGGCQGCACSRRGMREAESAKSEKRGSRRCGGM